MRTPCSVFLLLSPVSFRLLFSLVRCLQSDSKTHEAFESEVKMATLKTPKRTAVTCVVHALAHPYTHRTVYFPPSRAFSRSTFAVASVFVRAFASRTAIVRPRNQSVDIFCNRGQGPLSRHSGITYNPSRGDTRSN